MDHYHINIFWSAEDGCFIADVPDLRYCKAHDDTPEDALSEVQVAKKLWLDTARELGKPIPKPAYKPEIYQATV